MKLNEHDRAFILAGVEEYCAATGWSQRWVGHKASGDYRMIPNIRRGQEYPPAAMLALLERLQRHWGDQLANQHDWTAEPSQVAA